MRGKRSKQYRKLMHQYGLTFGFREPYQVLLDAETIQVAGRFKIDLLKGLERTLHGQIKPMISQCSIRHLYADRENQGLIEQAKTYERRRCNHHTLEKPLSTLECFQSVVDPKDSKTNTHRYVVASQDAEVRAHMRRVAGVPLVYINRSVMIMEPMARATEDVREREEKSKFRAGLVSRQSRSMLGKRKRDQDGVARADSQPEEPPVQPDQTSVTKRSRKRGPKEPNPLSVRKPKSRDDSERRPQHASKDYERDDASTNGDTPSGKRKRRRKPSNKAEGGKLGDAEE